jgi:hypothetical protein
MSENQKTLIQSLENIKLDEDRNVDILVENLNDKTKLSEIICDLSNDLEIRIKALDIYYTQVGQEEVIELINRIAMMYQFSGTKSARVYLIEVCRKSRISSFLKIVASKALCYFDLKQTVGFDTLNYVLEENMLEQNLEVKDNTLSTPFLIDSIKLLMKCEKHKENATKYFTNFLNDMTIECEYRYKTLLSIEKMKLEKELNDYFLSRFFQSFLLNSKNRTTYRILSGQYLLQKKLLEDTTEVENVLLSFAQDNDLDYNLRADATDVVLSLGKEGNKIIAQNIIMMLGRLEGQSDGKNIYQDAQNVHRVEESVLEGLEFLTTVNIKDITFEDVLIDFQEYLNITENIQISINRIQMDRALYSRYNLSLNLITLRLWVYIKSHEFFEEMLKRLEEELEDMSGKCSSGYAGRLVNVMSGFGDFSLRISWRDSITSKFIHKLNNKVMELTDETFQEKILEEMTFRNSQFALRPNILKFYRENMFNIRDEIWEECKNTISETDFDLYFRSAIQSYEGS